MYLCR